ncbi:Sbal_3080 family lipoprotein [Acinetobacter sp. P8-3-8]|uniref:Sbal_3080 family lipoprotein n=1 Tax=Acinetobacter sp. P8-3-8 TaxID=1029823 RepID=UPI00024869B7|nr:Sbal_3080 family lipoprotein [Acinetobacter sp. P8-3-8]
MKQKLFAVAMLVLTLNACTSIQVNNNDGFQPQSVKQICVIHNSKVTIGGFEPSIIRSFARYNINARIYPENSRPVMCETTMNYTALRSWDFVTYLTYAKFTLSQQGRIVSEAEFKLKGKGGLALNKWRSTDTKIDELVDQLVKPKTK